MESAATPHLARQVDAALIEAAARHAARSTAAAAAADDPAGAIDAAIDAFSHGAASVMPSVFVIEHGRLWLVAQRGYAVAPDGITVERGVIGRACRLGRAQLVPDVRRDRDYVPALPGIVSELAIPLRSDRELVGALNIESERPLPRGAVQAVRPLARALAPLAAELRERGTLDLAALARLFVHLGSLRDPEEIAELAAASLARVLPVDASHVVVWDELGSPRELAGWRTDSGGVRRLTLAEIESARDTIDSTAVCEVLDVAGRSGAPRDQAVIWLPLRANASDLGALVAISRSARHVDPRLLDTAAVLAAHVGVSLDAALALRRERRSALSDPLTGILNRRGLEERLELELAASQELRVPLSLIVIDCDDFKDVNDRAGHEFGDTILREIADVLSRSIPEGAVAARIGGDEFVVMLPGSGAEVAETLGGEIRVLLAKGLTEAGFPVRISAGIATYPYDGAAPSVLLRAADQALYVAKSGGKDRVASFREVASRAVEGAQSHRGEPAEGRRRGRSDGSGSMLADAISAIRAIETEESVDGVCRRLCKTLVFVVGATGCSVSRVVDDLLVEVAGHALREVRLGDEVAYRIADFPATEGVLRSGRPHAISFADQHVDPAEAFILRDLGMNALLMFPIVVDGESWGLVELYEMRLRSFDEDEIAVAEFLVHQAERRLVGVGDTAEPTRQRPIYELPPDRPRGPRTR